MSGGELEFRVLGPLTVVRQGVEVPLGGARQRLVLALLLLNAGRVVAAERLVDQVWGEAAPATGTGPLRNHIWQLRRLLGPAEAEHTPRAVNEVLVSQAGGYRLDVDHDQVDSCCFERSFADARMAASEDPRRALTCLTEALELWRGSAFGDLAVEPALQAEATRLGQARVDAEELRAELLLATGDHPQAVTELEVLTQAHPEREHLWALAMTALYRSGRQADALRCFQSARARLVEEMGIEPGPELRQLEQAILRQDPALDGPTADVGSTGLVRHRSASPERPEREQAARPVTFLFTAVDQDAALGARSRPSVGPPLPLHDAIVSDAIEGHDGRVLQRTGDGFCAVFDRATEAVAAAIAAQAQIEATETGDRGRPRIRIAIHTGDAEVHEGNYSGIAVHRTARMRDACHGGQVLVSAATRELVVHAMPEQANLLDIGTWLFEGLGYPERVYQVSHPDLPAGFPPLLSARPQPSTIPHIPTSFVGRQGETAAIRDALRSNQLVTLTGEGGIGKTRLALEVAQQANSTEHPDGVWFCDVSSVADADGIAEQLATALGLATPAGTDVRAALINRLRGVRLLLLIDNSERLRLPIGELVSDILASSSDVRILATSRAPLRAAGEHVVHIHPLAVPDPDEPTRDEMPAVRLLVDRADAAGAPVSADDPALAEIARLLDGIPLAIELAAPRLASMSPRELAARLDHRFDLLAEASTAPARQRTLRATVDWSFNLLRGQAQTLFGALSVFRGGWTLDAAEAICTAAGLQPDTVAPLVAELAEQSMIRVDLPPGGTARYRMLETMLAYAAEHLAARPEMKTAVAERHAHYFIGFAEEAARHRRGPLEPAWVTAIDLEFDNLRAAYRWAIDSNRPGDGLRLVAALVDDITMRERLEVGRWAEELVSLPSAIEEPLSAVALGLAAHTAMVEFRLDDGVRLSRQAIELERQTGAAPHWLPRTILALLTGLAFVEGDAREHLEAMEEISRVTGDPMATAAADFNRVMIAILSEQPERGRRAAERLRALGIRTRNPTLSAMGLLTHGRVIAASQPALGARELREALAVGTSAHNTVLVHLALRYIQEINARSGDRTEALTSLRRIALTFERSGDVSQQLQTVLSMLDSLLALDAHVTLATICGALSQTPWKRTAASRMIEQAAAARLGHDGYVAAYRRGQAIPLSELAAFVSDFVQELANDDE